MAREDAPDVTCPHPEHHHWRRALPHDYRPPAPAWDGQTWSAASGRPEDVDPDEYRDPPEGDRG